MNDINIDLDWPWDVMHQAFFSDAKFVTIRSCRRSFKTAGAVRWIIEMLLENPGSKGIWVDTVNKNIDRYYERYFLPIVKDISKWNYQKKTLEFVNGSYLDFGSAENPQNLEGFEYDYGFLNEAGLILKKANLWDNSLVPMFKNAKAVRIVGTPKGKNKFHKLCNIQSDEWEHFHFTVHDCPFYTKEEIETLKANYPEEAWRQEYIAEFLDGIGQVFRNIQQCITDRADISRRLNGRYVMSSDLAKHQDFTVLYLADTTTNEVVWQDRFNQIDWAFQKKRIVETYKSWEVQELIIDSTGVGDSIFDDLSMAGLNVRGFKFTNSSKNQLVRNLSVAIDNAKIKFHGFPELLSELEVFELEVTPMGNIRYNAPSGYHDDCVMSLALINQLLEDDFNYEEFLVL